MADGISEQRPHVRRNLGFLEQSVTFQDPKEEILRNIKFIIRIRWILAPCIFALLIISGLLGFAGVSSFSQDQLTVNGINLGGVLLLNLVYVFAVKRTENPKPLVLFQILIDVFYFALTVYKTGGIVSPFVFLYFMVIFSGSILVSGKTAFLIAGIASVIHVSMGLLELRGLIPHQAYFSPFKALGGNATYQILSGSFAIFSFFAFAGLASFLSNRLAARRRWLESANRFMKRQNSTLMFLYRTSQAIIHCDTERDLVDFILRELLVHLNLDRALLYKVENRKGFRSGKQLVLVMTRERGDEEGEIEVLEPISEERDGESEVIPDGIQPRENSSIRQSEGGAGQGAGRGAGTETNSGTSYHPLIIPLKEDAGLIARCALFQEAYNTKDPSMSEFITIQLGEQNGMSPFAMAPMVLRGETIGVIGIDRMQNRGEIVATDFEILKMFAAQAAIAIKGMRR